MNIEFKQGKTFNLILRWETEPVVRKAITGISFASGAPRLTVAGHGMPNGWRGYIFGVKGPAELNAEDPEKVKDKDYYPCSVIDPNTVELNTVNAADFKDYVSGGFLAFYTPSDLAGHTARMTIRDKVGGAELFSLTTENARIVLDAGAKTIRLTVSATDTAALTWKKGVFDLEMVGPTGVVTELTSGTVTVTKEITV